MTRKLIVFYKLYFGWGSTTIWSTQNAGQSSRSSYEFKSTTKSILRVNCIMNVLATIGWLCTDGLLESTNQSNFRNSLALHTDLLKLDSAAPINMKNRFDFRKTKKSWDIKWSEKILYKMGQIGPANKIDTHFWLLKFLILNRLMAFFRRVTERVTIIIQYAWSACGNISPFY